MGKRFVAEFQVNQPEEFVGFILTDFFAKEGFQLTDYNGERVWKKGIGMLAAPQFIKVSYYAGQVHLEAWLKFAILPGVYCGEMGLDGFWGFAIKEQLKSRVMALIQLLQQQNGQAVPLQAQQSMAPPAMGYAPSAPAPYQAVPQPIVHNPTGKATTSLVLGLVGIVAWLVPLLGVIITVMGIITGVTGRKSTKRGQATAGLVLSIIFLAVSVLWWVLGIVSILF